MNPFLAIPEAERAIWNPGTLEMAQPVIEAVGIQTGMWVLEVECPCHLLEMES